MEQKNVFRITPNTPRRPPALADVRRLLGERLAHYATREPKAFTQLDGHYCPEGGDGLLAPDTDGDALTAQATCELMYGAYVRVLIPRDATPMIAARQLRKLAEWLERDGGRVHNEVHEPMLRTPGFNRLDFADDGLPF